MQPVHGSSEFENEGLFGGLSARRLEEGLRAVWLVSGEVKAPGSCCWLLGDSRPGRA